jgi:large subunit ribosomal protein L19
MNTIFKVNAAQIEKLTGGKNIPTFTAGDTLRVNVKIREGDRDRVQAYEGVCIARSHNHLHSSFTVRKMSYGEGVERVFPLYSPMIDSIEVVRRGHVRRAKLYYLRDRSGKSARIRERTTGAGFRGENAPGNRGRKGAAAAAAAAASPFLSKPNGKADNLELIKGVGPKLGELLTSLGVFHFSQVAGWNEAQIAIVDSKLGTFKGRIERDEWQEQARLLAAGDHEEFEKRFGEVGSEL